MLFSCLHSEIISVYSYLRVLGAVLKLNPMASTLTEEGQKCGKSKLLNPGSKNEVRALPFDQRFRVITYGLSILGCLLQPER